MATQYTAGLTTGQVLTAATMNSIGAAWENYTPVIKQGTTTISATINYAKYMRLNKSVFVQVLATATSAGTGAGNISISQPGGLLAVSQGLNNRIVGSMQVEDIGVGFYSGSAVAISDVIVGFSGGGPRGNFIGNEPSFTVAIGDYFACSVCYEIA